MEPMTLLLGSRPPCLGPCSGGLAWVPAGGRGVSPSPYDLGGLVLTTAASHGLITP